MFNIKGAIFDVDGTLLDSQPMWDRVASDYLISRNRRPRPNLNDDLIALGGHEISGYFQAEYGLRESEEEIRSGIYGLMAEFYLHKAPLKEGVITVLNALRERGEKVGVMKLDAPWPFPEEEISDLGKRVDLVVTVEMNIGKYAGEIERACGGRCRTARINKNRGLIHSPEEILASLGEVSR